MATERSDRTAVFAGTVEGHELARHGAEAGYLQQMDFFVATDYGAEVLTDVEGIRVIEGRMDRDQMRAVLKEEGYGLVIDATHPYASQVTENIRSAADAAEVTYVRLLREEETPSSDRVTVVDDIEQAVKLLDMSDERFLLTTGSKDMGSFAVVRNFSDRAVARVLPGQASLEACLAAGMKPAGIICMQGPFTREMNLATMKQYGLETIVTKSTGRAGGFAEKTALAQDGYRVIVIGRPSAEEGLSLAEVMERLDRKYE